MVASSARLFCCYDYRNSSPLLYRQIAARRYKKDRFTTFVFCISFRFILHLQRFQERPLPPAFGRALSFRYLFVLDRVLCYQFVLRAYKFW